MKLIEDSKYWNEVISHAHFIPRATQILDALREPGTISTQMRPQAPFNLGLALQIKDNQRYLLEATDKCALRCSITQRFGSDDFILPHEQDFTYQVLSLEVAYKNLFNNMVIVARSYCDMGRETVHTSR